MAEQPGQSAGGMGHRRFTPSRRTKFPRRPNWEAMARSPPTPASPAMRRTTLRAQPACCAEPTRPPACLPQWQQQSSRRCPRILPRNTPRSRIPSPTAPISTMPPEAPLLNNNRHSTCADCHNSHGAQQVTSFNIPPLVRVSQTGAVGISMDGQTIVNPAVNQYENCLRCHGYSSGKQINPIYGYLPLRAEQRSAQRDSADEHQRQVESSGDACAQQRLAPAQSAAHHAGLERWHHQRPHHGIADLLHRLPQRRRQSRVRTRRPQWSAWLQVVARSGARIRRQPGARRTRER